MWVDARLQLFHVAMALHVLPTGMVCDECEDPAAELSVRCMGCLHPGPSYFCHPCHIVRHGPHGSLRRHEIHVWNGLTLVPLSPSAAPQPAADAAADDTRGETHTPWPSMPLGRLPTTIYRAGSSFASRPPFQRRLRCCPVLGCERALVQRSVTVLDRQGQWPTTVATGL